MPASRACPHSEQTATASFISFPQASCLSHSFQSIGLGLPSAIGLAVANSGKLAVLGAGDGGFLMSMADMETAVRLGLRQQW